MSEITNTKQILTEIMNEDAKDGIYKFNNTNKKLGMNESNPIGVLRLQQLPFSITFRWNDLSANVTLENGEDVIKLAAIFSDMLLANNIPHKLNYEAKHE
jgi:hypothetical protein